MCAGQMGQGGAMQRRGATGAPVAPIGTARPMGYGPMAPPAAPTGYSGPGKLAQAPPSSYTGIWNPNDPGMAAGGAGPSNPAANWAAPSSGLLGNSQYLALSRGNSADQAQLLGLLGGNAEAAHQLNQYTGPGGAGFNPTGYGTSTADLASGAAGIADLTQGQRDMYTANGIIGPDGKWLKRQNDAGEWVPIGGAGVPAAPAGMASAYRT